MKLHVEIIEATEIQAAVEEVITEQAELEAAWNELQSVPSYLEQQAAQFAAEA